MKNKSLTHSLSNLLYNVSTVLLGSLMALISLFLILFVCMPIFSSMNMPILDLPVDINFNKNIISNNYINVNSINGMLSILHPSFLESLLAMSMFMIRYLTALYIIYLLRKILFTIKEGEPFALDNGSRVRKIGIAVFVYPLITYLIGILINSQIIKNISISSYQLSGRNFINWEMIFVGLVIIALSEVFRLGIQIKEEQELTV